MYQYYQGHDAPGISLMYDLAHSLADCGHNVTVISGETGYMKTNVPELPWFRRIVRRERDGNVSVVRTYTYTRLHRSFTARTLGFVSFMFSCCIGLFSIEKPDVLLASSPPILPVFSSLLASLIRGIPFVLEVRDLWPESGVQMGAVRNKMLLSLLAGMEKTLYDKARRIIALTEGIRDDICGRGWSRDKVVTVTCGVDCRLMYPDDEVGLKVRERFGWGDKRVVLYFGALGVAFNSEVVLRAAKNLEMQEDVLFVLAGDGIRRGEIAQRIEDGKIRNVQVLGPIPKNEARSFINAADICLVTLQDIPLFRGAIPTKLIDYMACGKPVLCGVRGEAEHIVNEAGSGCPFEPDDDSELSRLVLELSGNSALVAQMGRSGREYVTAHFDLNRKQRDIEKILLECSHT